jgi:glycerophosphoryl diester phosphodiesterase
MIRIYAHRGASAELPENTLPAFARALELGADGIELDVHLSRDGVPVVIHDSTVDRTTDGTVAVANLTVAELQALDAGDGAPIPTLGDVLDLVGDRMHVDIEVKAPEAADAVLTETSRRPSLRYALSSFNFDVLRHARSVDPAVDLWPLTEFELVLGTFDEVLAIAKALGSSRVAVADAVVNAETLARIDETGASAWVWTVNDPDRAGELADLGVVGICTDNPALIIERVRKDGSHETPA